MNKRFRSFVALIFAASLAVDPALASSLSLNTSVPRDHTPLFEAQAFTSRSLWQHFTGAIKLRHAVASLIGVATYIGTSAAQAATTHMETASQVAEAAVQAAVQSGPSFPQHIVTLGQNLWRIGRMHGKTVEELIALNPWLKTRKDLTIYPTDRLDLRADTFMPAPVELPSPSGPLAPMPVDVVSTSYGDALMSWVGSSLSHEIVFTLGVILAGYVLYRVVRAAARARFRTRFAMSAMGALASLFVLTGASLHYQTTFNLAQGPQQKLWPDTQAVAYTPTTVDGVKLAALEPRPVSVSPRILQPPELSPAAAEPENPALTEPPVTDPDPAPIPEPTPATPVPDLAAEREATRVWEDLAISAVSYADTLLDAQREAAEAAASLEDKKSNPLFSIGLLGGTWESLGIQGLGPTIGMRALSIPWNPLGKELLQSVADLDAEIQVAARERARQDVLKKLAEAREAYYLATREIQASEGQPGRWLVRADALVRRSVASNQIRTLVAPGLDDLPVQGGNVVVSDPTKFVEAQAREATLKAAKDLGEIHIAVRAHYVSRLGELAKTSFAPSLTAIIKGTQGPMSLLGISPASYPSADWGQMRAAVLKVGSDLTVARIKSAQESGLSQTEADSIYAKAMADIDRHVNGLTIELRTQSRKHPKDQDALSPVLEALSHVANGSLMNPDAGAANEVFSGKPSFGLITPTFAWSHGVTSGNPWASTTASDTGTGYIGMSVTQLLNASSLNKKQKNVLALMQMAFEFDLAHAAQLRALQNGGVVPSEYKPELAAQLIEARYRAALAMDRLSSQERFKLQVTMSTQASLQPFIKYSTVAFPMQDVVFWGVKKVRGVFPKHKPLPYDAQTAVLEAHLLIEDAEAAARVGEPFERDAAEATAGAIKAAYPRLVEATPKNKRRALERAWNEPPDAPREIALAKLKVKALQETKGQSVVTVTAGPYAAITDTPDSESVTAFGAWGTITFSGSSITDKVVKQAKIAAAQAEVATLERQRALESALRRARRLSGWSHLNFIGQLKAELSKAPDQDYRRALVMLDTAETALRAQTPLQAVDLRDAADLSRARLLRPRDPRQFARTVADARVPLAATVARPSLLSDKGLTIYWAVQPAQKGIPAWKGIILTSPALAFRTPGTAKARKLANEKALRAMVLEAERAHQQVEAEVASALEQEALWMQRAEEAQARSEQSLAQLRAAYERGNSDDVMAALKSLLQDADAYYGAAQEVSLESVRLDDHLKSIPDDKHDQLLGDDADLPSMSAPAMPDLPNSSLNPTAPRQQMMQGLMLFFPFPSLLGLWARGRWLKSRVSGWIPSRFPSIAESFLAVSRSA